jgi:hypothetical protein
VRIVDVAGQTDKALLNILGGDIQVEIRSNSLDAILPDNSRTPRRPF